MQDVFFRIGGATAGSATDSLVVNSSHVILDDIWAWRADHGAGVGWTSNTADTGLTVNGNDVTAYGLAVEHYQKNEVVWNGQGGEDIFFQNEMPYDPPSQAAWMSGPTHGRLPGLPDHSQGDQLHRVRPGQLLLLQPGRADRVGHRVPGALTSRVSSCNNLLTRFLNGSGSIDHVVNDTGAAVTTANPGPTYVASYP